MAPKSAKGKAEPKAKAKAKAEPGSHPASKFSLNKKELEQVETAYNDTLAKERAAGTHEQDAQEKAEEARQQMKRKLQGEKAAKNAEKK